MVAGVGLADSLIEGIGIAGAPNGGVVSVQGVVGGTTLGEVDVTDRAARLVGIVDTELPTATAMINGRPRVTAPSTASVTYVYDPVGDVLNLARARDDNTDAQAATAAIDRLVTVDRLYVYNGASWDRMRAAAGDGVAQTGIINVGGMLFAPVAGTYNRQKGVVDNADAVAVSATEDRLATAARLYGYDPASTSWNRIRVNSDNTLRGYQPSTNHISVTGGANAIATATLPAAGPNSFHYITHIYIARIATAALAGGAILAVATTNLNGRAWRTGNQASITVSTFDGAILTDADFHSPIKSVAANTATTIVCPAAGAAVSWQIEVDYFISS